MSTGVPSASAAAQAQASSPSQDFTSLGIHNSNVKAAAGVSLSSHQKLIVGSVLDLFEGRPTLKNLSLWSRTATFQDPISKAQGFDKFAAQWYGLPALFHPIHIESHEVTSAGNPIELNLTNKYVVKGIKKEQVISSVVQIQLGDDGKIESLMDKWNGKLPDGPIAEAFRKLNAITVPAFVTVPKTEEEDRKMQAEREGRGN